MTEAPGLRGGMALLVLLTVFLNFATGGNALLALLPILVALAFYGLFRLSTRITFPTLLLMALVLDNPQDRPQQYRWQSIFYAPGELFYLNLHNSTGLSLLRFSLLEVLIMLLLLVAALRLFKSPGATWTMAPPLKGALWTYMGGMLFFCAWGLMHGGDGQQLLWQVRQLAWFPALTLLGAVAFQSRADLWRLGAVVLGAAVIRSLEGIYYAWFVAAPEGYDPDYVTTHGDSVLFVIAFMISVVALLERPGVFTVLVALFSLPPVGLALVLNNRRLAFVSLAAALVITTFSLRRAVKVWLFRLALLTAPLGVAYVAVGWSSDSPIFAPIAKLKSAADPWNTSNQTRDIENGNLIHTFCQHPLVGSGFGHPYIERVHAFAIEKIFPQYRYIAHNSVLWLWSQVGTLGFAILWMPLLVGVFLARRTYQAAKTATVRVTAMTTLTALIAYLGQAYGDMGLQSWTATLLLSVWLGAVGHQALVTGAWPALEPRSHRPRWPAVGMLSRRDPVAIST